MTVAIYHETSGRVGIFTPRGGQSARIITEQFLRRNPGADPRKLSYSRRYRLMGVWVDDPQRIPFEVAHGPAQEHHCPGCSEPFSGDPEAFYAGHECPNCPTRSWSTEEETGETGAECREADR